MRGRRLRSDGGDPPGTASRRGRGRLGDEHLRLCREGAVHGPLFSSGEVSAAQPPMSHGDLLRTKSREYELLAKWHAERAPLDGEHFVACQAMAVVGIVLRRLPTRST